MAMSSAPYRQGGVAAPAIHVLAIVPFWFLSLSSKCAMQYSFEFSDLVLQIGVQQIVLVPYWALQE